MLEVTLAWVTTDSIVSLGSTQLPVTDPWLLPTQIATVVGGIAALVAAGGVYLVWKQLRLAAWVNAQEIITDLEFVKARTAIQEHYEINTNACPSGDKDKALLVCRKMDQLCCLARERVLPENKFLKQWARPIGKCWIVTQHRWRMITDARKHDDNPTKWDAFMCIGERASKKL